MSEFQLKKLTERKRAQVFQLANLRRSAAIIEGLVEPGQWRDELIASLRELAEQLEKES